MSLAAVRESINSWQQEFRSIVPISLPKPCIPRKLRFLDLFFYQLNAKMYCFFAFSIHQPHSNLKKKISSFYSGLLLIKQTKWLVQTLFDGGKTNKQTNALRIIKYTFPKFVNCWPDHTSHISPPSYAVADNSYRSLRTEQKDQCILISGESGAGKTEASKKILQYYAVTCPASDQVQTVKDRLLQSNPVLEVSSLVCGPPCCATLSVLQAALQGIWLWFVVPTVRINVQWPTGGKIYL